MAAGNITLGINRFKHLLNQLSSSYLSITFITAFFLILSTVGLFFLINKSHDTHILKKKIEAKFILNMHIIKDKSIDYELPNGGWVKADALEFTVNKNVADSIKRTKTSLQISIMLSSFLSVLAFIALVFLFIKYGQKINKGKHIRGAVMAPVEKVNAQLKADKNIDNYKVGPLHLPKGFESTHMFVSGATGTGKSTGLKQVLDEVDRLDHKFICYDKSGEYVSQYYRKNFDIILNPFDARMPYYSFWDECPNDYDYESLASSLMPMPASHSEGMSGSVEGHFIGSGRTLLADCMMRLKETGQARPDELLRYLSQEPLKELHKFLKGTPSQSVVNTDNAKHASDVKSTVMPLIKSFRYLDSSTQESGFSIKQWVRNDYDNRRIFITSKGSQKEVLAPLISAWLDIFSKELLSLSEDLYRRIFMFIDELASLPKIESLPHFANEARKFGGCGVFSVTSVEELYRIYGRSSAKTMVSMCGTKLTYRSDEPDIAAWLSKLYMEEEIKEVKEGVNQQAQRADSVNTNESRTSKVLFTPSEIMALPNFECLAKIPGSYPVTKIKTDKIERPTIAKDYIEKQIKLKPLKSKSIPEKKKPTVTQPKITKKAII